jgi:hypothetical protein
MATAIPVCRTARQAKRAGPKLEAGPEASAERSEGTMEARRGETPQAARCAARQRDRPSPRWPGTPGLQRLRSNGIRTRTRKVSWICCECGLADPAQPGRRCSGAPSLRGGDSPQGFPLEASEARSAPSGARRHHAESSGRRLDSDTGIHGDDESSSSEHRARTGPKAQSAGRSR